MLTHILPCVFYQNSILEYKIVCFKIKAKQDFEEKKLWNKFINTQPFIHVRNRVIFIEKSSHDTSRNRNHKYPNQGK